MADIELLLMGRDFRVFDSVAEDILTDFNFDDAGKSQAFQTPDLGKAIDYARKHPEGVTFIKAVIWSVDKRDYTAVEIKNSEMINKDIASIDSEIRKLIKNNVS